MRAVDFLPHDGLRLEIFHLRIGFAVANVGEAGPFPLPSVVAFISRSSQRLGGAGGTSGRQGGVAVGMLVDRRRRDVEGQMVLFPAIADHVSVVVLVIVVVVFTLAPGGTEIAFLALATTSHARGVVGVVDTAEVATHLATTARNACLGEGEGRGVSAGGAATRHCKPGRAGADIHTWYTRLCWAFCGGVPVAAEGGIGGCWVWVWVWVCDCDCDCDCDCGG